MISFRLAGIAVELHFSFFAVLFLLIQITGSDWVLWGVLCCMIHETGHLTAYSLCGARPRELHLEAGGMRIVPPNGFCSAGREALILAGGPAANLLAAGLLFAAGAGQAAQPHLFLAGFNLLPLVPLDGGQLFALLLGEFLPPRPSAQIVRAVHLLCFAVLTGCGLLIFRQTGNFTLLLTLLCLTVG